jgi:hypothetical protein
MESPLSTVPKPQSPNPNYLPAHLPTYRPTYLPIDPPTYRSTTYLPTDPPTYPPTDLPSYRPTYLSTHLPTDRPTDLPTYLPTHLPIDLPTYQPTYLPTDLPTDPPTNRPTYLLQKPTQHGLRFLLISSHVFTKICLCLCVSISLSLSSHRGSVHDPAKIFPPSVRSQQVLSVKTTARGGAKTTSGGSTWKVTDARTNESGWMDDWTDSGEADQTHGLKGSFIWSGPSFVYYIGLVCAPCLRHRCVFKINQTPVL